ncbi:alpha/beta fold hydrolase [Candidatus Woesearchaeota archaeon]|nr:alpha/beta fold hydrolase [Candidatus Woesearchaeota archaeon]
MVTVASLLSITLIAGISIKENRFFESTPSLTVDPYRLNLQLAQFFEETGDAIFILAREQTMGDQEVQSMIAGLEGEMGGKCGIIAIHTLGQQLRIEGTENCKEEVRGMQVEGIRSEFTSLLDRAVTHQKFYENLIGILKTQLGVKGEIIKDFKVVLEKNAEGNVFKEVTANEKNTLSIEIFVPTKKTSRTVQYGHKEKEGSVFFKETDCMVKYQIRQAQNLPSAGSLELEEESLKRSSRIVLYYHPPKEIPAHTNQAESELEIDFSCGSKDEKVYKANILIARPIVIVVPGLWHGSEESYSLTLNGLENEGFEVKPFWFDDVAGDIKENAQLINEFVKKIQQEKEARGIKAGKLYYVGHSMGGLIGAYYIANLGGSQHISKVATLGTPYKGAPVVESFHDACPIDPYSEQDARPMCPGLREMVSGMRKKFRMEKSAMLTLGQGLFQMLPGGNFLEREMRMIPPETTFIAIAGTKAFIPDWLEDAVKGVPNVVEPYVSAAKNSVSWLAGYDITPIIKLGGIVIMNKAKSFAESEGIGISPEMTPTFEKLIQSFFAEGTDGSVPRLSALSLGQGRDFFVIPPRRLQVALNHGSIFRSEAAVEIIASELYGKEYTFVSKGSPGKLSVVDKKGIPLPDSVPVIGEGNSQIIILDGEVEGDVIVKGTEQGIVTLSINKVGKEKSWTASFDNFIMSENTQARYSVADKPGPLEIDNDGDGITDTLLSPDFSEETSNAPEAAFAKSGTLIIERKNQTPLIISPITWLIVSIAIILAAVFYLRKRKN